MPELFAYILFFVLFFIIELIYFRLALRYKVIDKPNERSSHLNFTIRGGGVIFPVAVLCWFLIYGFQAPFFVAGLILIAVVSFIDDIEHIHTKIRFVFQLIAVTLMLYQVPIAISPYWFPVIFLFIVGTINAYNFMDGINGITGFYSLITILSLLWININLHFIDSHLLILILLSLIVFGWFNFRKKAKCFAGDIGSVSIAFIICYLLINLIAKTHNFTYILFLLVYGVDAGTTMLFRLIRRENIFEAHRSHFYQYLANEKKWPHLSVSSLYAGVQLLINILLIIIPVGDSIYTSLGGVALISFASAALIIFLRFKMQGKEQLLS